MPQFCPAFSAKRPFFDLPRARGLTLGFNLASASRLLSPFHFIAPQIANHLSLPLSAFVSLADVAKGGDGAKSALCELPLFVSIRGSYSRAFAVAIRGPVLDKPSIL
jgi:hypothetical protein